MNNLHTNPVGNELKKVRVVCEICKQEYSYGYLKYVGHCGKKIK